MRIFAATTVISLFLALGSADVRACSPAFEEPFQTEPIPVAGEVLPTTTPVARVVSVDRGHRAKRGESTCSEVASVVIAVNDEFPKGPFVYTFEQVSGAAPDSIFPPGFFAGRSNGAGERIFAFYWLDLEQQPKPFEMVVKITAHSRSGTPGPSALINITSAI